MISAMTAYYANIDIEPPRFPSSENLTDLKISERDSKFWVMCFAEEQIPKPKFLGLHFQLLHNWNDGSPSFLGVGRDLLMGDFNCGQDFILMDNLSYE